MATKQDVAMIVAMISAGYPNFNATEMTMEVYYQTLKDIDPELLKAAALQAIAQVDRKFAPSVGEIRGMVSEINKIGAGLPTSFQAWQEVQKQIVDNGGDYGTPVWSHPLVEQAVKAIGWRNLRMSEDAVADRARFIQCYEQFATRHESLSMMLPEVKGYIEQNGTLPAIEAGNPASAIKTLASGMKG